jgi:hypothetical protein
LDAVAAHDRVAELAEAAINDAKAEVRPLGVAASQGRWTKTSGVSGVSASILSR